jgi:hypothetical protein
MWAALGHVLPIAVAVALSSVPIMATILILLSPNKSRSSLTFLIGWILGIAVVVVAFTLLAHVIPSGPPRKSQAAIGISLIVIGLALVVFAIIVWRRGAGKPSSGIPKWLSAVGSLGPWSALGLAFVLNLRPKAILLAAAAGLSLRGDDLTVGETAIVIGVYTVISASAVAIPIIASLVAPEKTGRWLVRARAWIAENNRIVSILILIMIGVVIIGNGLTHL